MPLSGAAGSRPIIPSHKFDVKVHGIQRVKESGDQHGISGSISAISSRHIHHSETWIWRNSSINGGRRVFLT